MCKLQAEVTQVQIMGDRVNNVWVVGRALNMTDLASFQNAKNKKEKDQYSNFCIGTESEREETTLWASRAGCAETSFVFGGSLCRSKFSLPYSPYLLPY